MFKTSTVAAIAGVAQASIFWEKLTNFYSDLSLENFEEVLAW